MCNITLNIRECSKLEGTSNFVPYKISLQILMEEAKLWEHVVKVVPKPIDST